MVSSNRSCEENLNNFTCIINYALDTLTPLKTVVTNHNDRPWMNNNLRTLINKMQKALAQGNQTPYKMLRNKVNRSRKRCRKLYYENKVKDMKHILNQRTGGGKCNGFVVFRWDHLIIFLQT